MFGVNLVLRTGGNAHARTGSGERSLASAVLSLPIDARRRAVHVGCVLGGVAVAAFAYMTTSAGGLLASYGQAKGGAGSQVGWLSKAPMMALPAIVLLFIGWSGNVMTWGHIATIAAFASPHLIHGILGTRRGPAFSIFATLFFGAFVIRRQRPRVITILAAMFGIGVLVLFLINNRDRIYLGGDVLAEWSQPGYRTAVSESGAEDVGEDWLFSAGVILTSRDSGTHFWGTRYLMNMFVRPIPRAVWPTKYEDTGFGWIDGQSDMEGMADSEWVRAVGWIPVRGAAAGLVADTFLEFSYFGIVACALAGWFYGYVWWRMIRSGGVWTILFVIATSLCIYVPTQNVTAWLYRFMLMGVPMIIVWKLYIDRRTRLFSDAPIVQQAAESTAPIQSAIPAGLLSAHSQHDAWR